MAGPTNDKLLSPEAEAELLAAMRQALSQVALAQAALAPQLERLGKELAKSFAPILEEATRKLRSELAVAMAPALAQLASNVELQAALAQAGQELTRQAGIVEALEGTGYRSDVYALAATHHGLVTTEMARSVGVPSVELRKLAARGGMSNLARGLYRVDGIDGGERAPYAEAVLRVGEDAHLVGDSVLALHHLGFANPPRIRVGTARRVRRHLPAHIQVVHRANDTADITEYHGIPSITVAAAIRDSIGTVSPEKLLEAVDRGAEEGLVRRRDLPELLSEIESAV